MMFYDFAKHQKTISKTTFWSLQKGSSKYLINPVEYEDFWSSFSKIASESIKKALRFALKVDDVLRLCKSSKKH